MPEEAVVAQTHFPSGRCPPSRHEERSRLAGTSLVCGTGCEPGCHRCHQRCGVTWTGPAHPGHEQSPENKPKGTINHQGCGRKAKAAASSAPLGGQKPRRPPLFWLTPLSANGPADEEAELRDTTPASTAAAAQHRGWGPHKTPLSPGYGRKGSAEFGGIAFQLADASVLCDF